MDIVLNIPALSFFMSSWCLQGIYKESSACFYFINFFINDFVSDTFNWICHCFGGKTSMAESHPPIPPTQVKEIFLSFQQSDKQNPIIMHGTGTSHFNFAYNKAF